MIERNGLWGQLEVRWNCQGTTWRVIWQCLPLHYPSNTLWQLQWLEVTHRNLTSQPGMCAQGHPLEYLDHHPTTLNALHIDLQCLSFRHSQHTSSRSWSPIRIYNVQHSKRVVPYTLVCSLFNLMYIWRIYVVIDQLAQFGGGIMMRRDLLCPTEVLTCLGNEAYYSMVRLTWFFFLKVLSHPSLKE